ncbi:MAG: hemerythrin domain-containing protein [Betaproteobacteria bacterium]|nr:hemerythrin domain-containing protein [Betaproteobacteria bacterium]
MSRIGQILPHHHRHCDVIFTAAEKSAQRGNWTECDAACEQFSRQLLAHFDAEESLLFPAFESASGMREGPTQVMRLEHGQMRQLLGQLGAARLARDAETFAGVAETLLILMQQHNMKEENILYPMCDRVLEAQTEQLAAQLQARLELENA